MARRRQKARRDAEERLFDFFVHSWHVLEPHNPLDSNWHLGLIAEHLEAVKDRQIPKLVINIPTRYLKSMLCTIAFPAWTWITDPGHKFIFSSYSHTLSSQLSYKRRNLIESDWYQENWGERVRFADDQNQKTYYENTERGFMFSTSTGGSITGIGCDTMIIDDPHKPFEAENEAFLNKDVGFWKTTLNSRFNKPKDKGIVLVMQRLHDLDHTGYFLTEESGFEHLKIPNQSRIRNHLQLSKNRQN